LPLILSKEFLRNLKVCKCLASSHTEPLKGLYTLDTFAHNIASKNDSLIFYNFEPWFSMTNQGKLLKNSTQGLLGFLRAYLRWSIETYGSKLINIEISFNFFIAILCAKISCV